MATPGNKINVHKINNANVYIDGVNLLGRAMEVELPELSMAMQEHEALGMIVKMELPGGFEALEGKITWNSYYEEVMRLVSDPYTNVNLSVRGNLQRFDSRGLEEEVQVRWDMLAAMKNTALGSLKQHEGAEPETEFAIYTVKVLIDNVEIVYLDGPANIFKVNGQDKLAAMRRNIGA